MPVVALFLSAGKRIWACMGSVSSHCPESSKLVIQASTTGAELNGVNTGFCLSIDRRISMFDYESSTYITSLISVNSKDQEFSNFIFISSNLLLLLY